MKKPIGTRILLAACSATVILCMLVPTVWAASDDTAVPGIAVAKVDIVDNGLINEKLDALSEQLDNMEDQIDDLEDATSDLKDQIKALTDTTKSMKNQLSAMADQISGLSGGAGSGQGAGSQEVLDQLEELSDRIDQLSATVEGLDAGAEELPDQIGESVVSSSVTWMDTLSDAAMTGVTSWIYRALLVVTEMLFTNITASSASIFEYSWFKVIVGLFTKFGWLLFAVGVLLSVVDFGIEYRRHGADPTGAMLNFGKGMLVVGLFSTVPVPLFNFCVNVQSVIMRRLAINWSFESVSETVTLLLGAGTVMAVIFLIVIAVLIFLVFLDSLKRGGILLVQICIGSLHMLSVPRGYMDNFYGWCKQVIGLCLTVLLQNLILFCGLMIIPTNLFLGIGTMFVVKEVPRICGQFGLDTSVKASFTNMAMGANASIQALKVVGLFA